LGGMDLKEVASPLLRIFLCSLPMGFVSYLICSLGDWSSTGHGAPKVVLLMAAIAASLGTYLGSSYWMKNAEMIFLLKMIRKKR